MDEALLPLVSALLPTQVSRRHTASKPGSQSTDGTFAAHRFKTKKVDQHCVVLLKKKKNQKVKMATQCVGVQCDTILNGLRVRPVENQWWQELVTRSSGRAAWPCQCSKEGYRIAVSKAKRPFTPHDFLVNIFCLYLFKKRITGNIPSCQLQLET